MSGGNPNYFPPIPVMQIRPGCLLFYDQRYSSGRRKESTLSTLSNNTEKPQMYTGKLNEKSKSKIRFAVNLLAEQAKWKEVENPTTGKFYKFKLNFITLTLSAAQRNVTDREVKSEMLAPWIKNMRNVQKLRSYVWRAERQKNGNIHFHFSTDTYIPYDAIRDAWNFQQEKFHFIEEFRNRNKSQFPNSTDVHPTLNIKNLGSYLVKYMAKDEKGLDTIDGKVWDCSQNLKTKERVAFAMDSSDFRLSKMLFDRFSKRAKIGDECSIIPISTAEMRRYLPREKMKQYDDWLDRVYHAADR